jgi:CRISPR-associated endonuclease/helicase Cas3
MHDTLLAKSKSGPNIVPEITLTGHTDCVLRAVDALFLQEGAPTRLAGSWLQFFGLGVTDFGRFHSHLRVAAAFHDVGKANDGFQDKVLTGGPQLIRHEHLSGLLMAEPDVLECLTRNGLDAEVLIAAVISHHLKVSHECFGQPQPGGLQRVEVYLSHDDFGAVWERVSREVGAECPRPVGFPRVWVYEAEIKGKRLEDLKRKLHKAGREFDRDEGRRRLLHAVRAGLIAGDSVGSALVRMPGDPKDPGRLEEWIKGAFPPLLTDVYIRTNVIDRRIEELERQGRWRGDFDDFQKAVADEGSRVLLTAPCGSGKTLAAWKWIETRLYDRPASRVLFLYPTRATATEGFRDYVSWAPESDAALATGTSAYELEGMFESPDNREPGDGRAGRNYKVDERLFALGLWPRRIFSATADQFLAFLQYGYGSICLLPLLADSVLVVDEVHSFDRGMFAALKRFLKEFPTIPTLCMTATLPVDRRDALVKCGLKLYSGEGSQALKNVADHDRYHIHSVSVADAESAARAALKEGKRVLWVVNRVAKCQELYRTFRGESTGGKVVCYHSRFKLKDRQQRHNEIIAAFRAPGDGQEAQAVLGITTQVCEMSLDLDTDLLITEHAPIASLIQRMGRCNRKWPIPLGRIGQVYIYDEGNDHPYHTQAFEGQMGAAREFVKSLADRVVTQSGLEAAYETFDPSRPEPGKSCQFLDSGAYAKSGEETFRDIEEFTKECVLLRDVPEVLRWIEMRKPWDGFRVPVPKQVLDKTPLPNEGLPRWVSVAPDSHYSRRIGFCNEPLNLQNDEDE